MHALFVTCRARSISYALVTLLRRCAFAAASAMELGALPACPSVKMKITYPPRRCIMSICACTAALSALLFVSPRVRPRYARSISLSAVSLSDITRHR